MAGYNNEVADLTVWNDQRVQTYELSDGSLNPRQVKFDPDNWVLDRHTFTGLPAPAESDGFYFY